MAVVVSGVVVAAGKWAVVVDTISAAAAVAYLYSAPPFYSVSY